MRLLTLLLLVVGVILVGSMAPRLFGVPVDRDVERRYAWKLGYVQPQLAYLKDDLIEHKEAHGRYPTN